MAQIENRFTIGNLANLAAVLVLAGTLAAGWGAMTERSDNTRKAIDALASTLDREAETRRTSQSTIESRVRALEAQQARADERFNSVLQVLGRIEARLERIENR